MALSGAEVTEAPGVRSNGCVLLILEDSLSAAATRGLIDEGIAAARRSAAPGILLDLRRLPSPIHTLDAFAVGEHLARALVAHHLCAAFLTTPARAVDGRFIETVCVNRGGRSRAFVDLAKAEAWVRRRGRA